MLSNGHLGAPAFTTGVINCFGPPLPGNLQQAVVVSMQVNAPMTQTMPANDGIRLFEFEVLAGGNYTVNASSSAALAWALFAPGSNAYWVSRAAQMVSAPANSPITLALTPGWHALVVFREGYAAAVQTTVTASVTCGATPIVPVPGSTVAIAQPCQYFNLQPSPAHWNLVAITSQSDWSVNIGGVASSSAGSACDVLVANGHQGAVAGGDATFNLVSGSGASLGRAQVGLLRADRRECFINMDGEHGRHAGRVLGAGDRLYIVTVFGPAGPRLRGADRRRNTGLAGPGRFFASRRRQRDDDGSAVARVSRDPRIAAQRGRRRRQRHHPGGSDPEPHPDDLELRSHRLGGRFRPAAAPDGSWPMVRAVVPRPMERPGARDELRSHSQLTATVPAALLAQSGTVAVTVITPPPAGGLSLRVPVPRRRPRDLGAPPQGSSVPYVPAAGSFPLTVYGGGFTARMPGVRRRHSAPDDASSAPARCR